MCLAIPGQVLEIADDAVGMPAGRVSYGGVVKDVCFSLLPDARPGDWVLVHVGFAISRLDEAEARRVFGLLAEMEGDEVPR
jgi:hydrogenase expression/formation protein HypC